jgi:primosomal protein N' (replication factor Y) (superfamily II helicase)
MYAEVALAQAVRQVFTYSLNEELMELVQPGMRVWIPLGNRKVIGMVVRVHANKPSFACKPVVQVLDTEPVFTTELLDLTQWVSQYYYSAWGEVIQAALPVGLNYAADRHLSVIHRDHLTPKESEICDEIQGLGEIKLDEAERRWGHRPIQVLIRKGSLELSEFPKQKVSQATLKGFTWSNDQQEQAESLFRNWTGRAYAWISAIPVLFAFEPPVSQKELTQEHGLTPHTLGRLEKEGLIQAMEVPVEALTLSHLEYEPSRLRILNAEQEQVFEPIKKALDTGSFQSFLLYGITGSGKTEVYIHALKQALEQGKGGLILVPEIALTPQTVRRFYEIFGDQIAVLHSRLTDRERFEAWKALRSGEKMIAIGARSAVFAPVQNLGIIIIDEEHDQSYKQEDPAPRYHAREVAIVRASRLQVPIVFGSATPSMISLNAVTRGKHTMLKLTGRHLDAVLPPVKVLDLRQYRNAMRGPIAVPLAMATEEAIERGEQVIMLHNRRGYAAYQQCNDCGHVAECPNCSVSLTLHRTQNSLRCHYCGFSRRAQSVCDHCDSEHLDNKGSGTQRVEEELQEVFPKARILRMDRDTTSGKDAHNRILSAFGNGEADILVGTQLVAKGLDFPNVTVVGVINADTELAFPSYRSAERMFQLLTQVAGRAGRAEKKGNVFLQTRMPEHPAIIHASGHDFESFARYELSSRKELQYPPYSRLIQFHFKSPDGTKVSLVAEMVTKIIEKVFNGHQVLGPAPSVIQRLYNDFRWECFVKLNPTTGTKKMEFMLDQVFTVYEKHKPQGASTVRINVNVDV